VNSAYQFYSTLPFAVHIDIVPMVQGLGDEPLAGQRLTGREQLFTPRSDDNIVLVARSLAPAQYMQCTESFLISANDVPCHSCR
jgi:hypothetical protein